MAFAAVTQVGEAFVGSGAEAAHVNTVLGRRGGPVETAWATALATPRAGHVPFVVVLCPNLPVQPPTLFVNKATLSGDEQHERLTWGAAQAGVAAGVTAAVCSGIVPANDVGALLLIAAVWVSPAAGDEGLVFANNRQATETALAAGASGTPSVSDVLAAGEPENPYFGPPARPVGDSG